MTRWPKEVNIPKYIGKDDFTYPNGRPKCALGHLWANLDNEKSIEIWEKNYLKCWETLHQQKTIECVMVLNDQETAKNRLLLYAATWVACGYHVTNFPQAVKLGRQTIGQSN